jgi:CheY-like chemotaxis protein
MNGWEFLREKSRDDELNGVPVLVVTANPVPLEDDGVTAVMQKPLRFDRLRIAIEKLCPQPGA